MTESSQTQAIGKPGPKSIVLCADGTGNADVKGRGSNVFKLFEAVDTTFPPPAGRPRQIAFYDEGVGTEDFWPRRIMGGALGWGLAANVCELYTELARVYVPGDRVYLFGFSRGAFTVRTLAQMIEVVGILDGQAFNTAAGLVAAATRSYETFITNGDVASLPGKHNYTCHRAHTGLVPCLGVWDTVDAVGFSIKAIAERANVYKPFKCDISRLPGCVAHAYHALALDDQRHAFWPELWQDDQSRVTEVWFAGVHSDVGGGYPRQGLSLITLYWMMKSAEGAGLRFNQRDIDFCKDHQNSADKLHDSRRGTGLYYRWRPREKLFEAQRHTAQVHISVFERAAQGVDGYSPANIPSGSEVSVTGAPSALVAADILQVLTKYDSERDNARAAARSVIRTGVRSYRAFVVGSLVTATALGLASILLLVRALLSGGTDSRVLGLWLMVAVALLIIGTSLLFYALLTARNTDDSVDKIHTSLWQRMRSELQVALRLR